MDGWKKMDRRKMIKEEKKMDGRKRWVEGRMDGRKKEVGWKEDGWNEKRKDGGKRGWRERWTEKREEERNG